MSLHRLVMLQKRVTQAAWRLEFFTTNQWKVDTENVYRLLRTLSNKDAVTFNFDLRNINWYEYVFEYCMGVRRHIMKECDTTVPAAKRRLAR
jgi:fatty acyl-CoA reductase